MPTKLYKNNGDKKLSILGLGDLEPGEQISVSGEYLPQVILENYSGLADITDSVDNKPSPTPAVKSDPVKTQEVEDQLNG